MKKYIENKKAIMAVAAFVAVSSYVSVKTLDIEFKNILKPVLHSLEVNKVSLNNLNDNDIKIHESFLNYKKQNKDKITVEYGEYKKICNKYLKHIKPEKRAKLSACKIDNKNLRIKNKR